MAVHVRTVLVARVPRWHGYMPEHCRRLRTRARDHTGDATKAMVVMVDDDTCLLACCCTYSNAVRSMFTLGNCVTDSKMMSTDESPKNEGCKILLDDLFDLFKIFYGQI